MNQKWAEARVRADRAARIGIWASVRAAALSGRGRWLGASPKDTALDAAWTAAALNLGRGKWTRAWLPLVDAHEAGLWLYWLLRDEVLLLPRPVVSTFNGRLHHPDGPAVWWPDGARYYFWHGRRVTEEAIMRPQGLTTRRLITERNPEIRRAMIERLGYENVLAMVGRPRPAHQDATGELFRIQFVGDEPLTFVRVTDPSTGRTYCLRVPLGITTARAGVAWTFGMDGAAWEPMVET